MSAEAKTIRRSAAAIAVIAALCLSACHTLDQAAPPAATLSASPSESLKLGRALYVTKCAKCHAPEPVLNYTAAEWKEIMVDMAEETNLTEHETAAVKEYVWAVLAQAGKS